MVCDIFAILSFASGIGGLREIFMDLKKFLSCVVYVASSIVAVFGYSVSASAYDTLKVCDGCDADQMWAAAWHDANAEQAPFWGYKYYINRENGQVSKFVTSKENGPPGDACPPGGGLGCQDVVMVFPDMPEHEFVEYGFQAQQVWGSEIVITPGPGVPNNAYEFVMYPQMREVTMAQAHTKAAFLNALTQTVRGLVDKHLVTLPPKVVSVTLVYPDGSRSIAFVDPVTERMTHEKNTVRDRVGNFVPESPAMVAGGVGQVTHYDFTNNPEDRFKFINWLQGLGISVGGQLGEKRIRCAETAENTDAGIDVKIKCEAY